VHGIKGKESGLWLTPTATDIGTRSKEAMEKRKNYRTSIGRTTVPPGNLAEQVQYGMPTVNMFPTPRVSDIEGGAAKNVKIENGHFYRENKKGERWGVKLRDVMEMYPTPRASAAMTEDMETIAKRNKYNSKLEEKIAMDMYPTPTTRDHKDSTLSPAYQNRNSDSLPIKMMKKGKPGGKLNPEFVEFLMGYPLNWTKVETTE
jgi:hypothetical protein